jgi:membrane-associated protease RseP (regulator of RpoE activity)
VSEPERPTLPAVDERPSSERFSFPAESPSSGDRPVDWSQPRARDRWWLNGLLLLVTIWTMTGAGRGFYLNYILDLVPRPLVFTTASQIWIGALWFSLSGIAILLSHEMGHYLACRYYRIDASPPYFLPFPNIFGTMGAFIRIRSPFPHRRALFDVGVAGPFAGFVVAVLLLIVGVAWSRVVPYPKDFVGIEFGEPLIFKAVAWAFWGRVSEGQTLNLHPMGFAAWAGCFLTAINLLPIWQLDGGHIAYSVVGRRARYVTFVGTLAMIALTFLYTYTWAAWVVLIVVMIFFFGPDHAPTLNDEEPLGTRRTVLAVLAGVVLILCFTPVPIDVTRLIGAR